MNEIIKINDTELEENIFKGQRVVTFKDIDLVHKRVEGTAKRNFSENKKHLIEGIDYFEISTKIVPSLEAYGFSKFAPSGTILTESGYLMIVKKFNR